MSDKILLPKFLTRDVAILAVATVVEGVITSRRFVSLLKRLMFHIVVLVPARREQTIGPSGRFREWPNEYSIEPHVLYEYSHGDESEWPHEFREIARSKAHQRWCGLNEDQTDIMPHLLAPGDTPFWGTAEYKQVVVACSGVQPWFDSMIAGMVAHMCVALAHDEWMKSQNKRDEVSLID